ncbi:hypothetical protein [uncultured Desulfobulbus sp.]|uniref:hypothetical protein n=1 Tax=uncultured Desulfobulbus sp. TaxID=239745 RepID=UPI0029C6EA92|nr:hypothetical protein [uncultured Desulfobulbus sp.]
MEIRLCNSFSYTSGIIRKDYRTVYQTYKSTYQNVSHQSLIEYEKGKFMLRKFLAVIGGLVVAVAIFMSYPYFEESWISKIGMWWICVGAIPSGIIVGLIANNKYWIPGLIVGIITGAVMLFFIAWKMGVSYYLAGFEEYAGVTLSLILPVIFAEITGRSIAHLRTNTKKSQINLKQKETL